MQICYEVRQLYLKARVRLCRTLARMFGTYIEVETPTLKYRAYVWRGNYWIIY